MPCRRIQEDESVPPLENLGQAAFGYTRHLRLKLVFQGHLYIKNAKGEQGLFIWRCLRTPCPGRLVATPMGMVVGIRRPHNHAPPSYAHPRPILHDNLGQAETIFSQNGTARLCFKGYSYKRRHTKNWIVCWVCTDEICNGRVKATPIGLVVELCVSHNHEPNPERIRALMKISKARERSLTFVDVEKETSDPSLEKATIFSNPSRLWFKGYRYRLLPSYPSKKIDCHLHVWKCTGSQSGSRKCPGKILVTPSGHVVKVQNLHNHEPVNQRPQDPHSTLLSFANAFPNMGAQIIQATQAGRLPLPPYRYVFFE